LVLLLQFTLIIFSFLVTRPIFAIKTNQAIYQDPFDKAAGGADLTRASQDAVAFANPALLPWGGKGFRWWGGQAIGHYTPSSVAAAQSLLSGGESEDASGAGSILDTLFTTPVRVGATSVGSLVTNNFIGTGLNIQKIDLEARKYGSVTGGPAIQLVGESYSGIAVGVASRVGSFMSIGITPKYIIKTEPIVDLSLTDTAAIENLDANTIANEQTPAGGGGADLGWLLFLQGYFMDFRLALKVDDIGNTKFAGEQVAWKQTTNLGLGITLHGDINAIHLSLDYRDIGNSYNDKIFKKIYGGVKVLIFNYLGVAIGLHHGIPSYGIRADLWLFSIGATQYSEEMTNVIGEKRRDIQEIYFAMGI